MAVIRPSVDLRNRYNEISKICHETNEPIYITKNSYNDLVILSNEAYEKLYEDKENQIEKLVAKHFEEQYKNYEEFEKDFIKKLEQSIKDKEEGKCRPIEDFCAEMEEKYYINGDL